MNFQHSTHATAGVVQTFPRGIINSISDGSFTLTDDNQVVEPYFRVRVGVLESRLRNVPSDFKLISGMTLQGDILVGRRTAAPMVAGA